MPRRRRSRSASSGSPSTWTRICLGQLEARIRDPGLQASVVAQQQQSLAVEVETPGRIDPGHVDELGERPARRARSLIGELRQHSERLVEQDQPGHAPITRRRRQVAVSACPWCGWSGGTARNGRSGRALSRTVASRAASIACSLER
jgi:hypothetical protein